MATILPTVLELYDTYKAALEAKPEHQTKDWSAGSWLDAFGSVAAVAGIGIMRYAARQFLRTYLHGVDGADLDYLAQDRYGLERLPGETDDEFRDRIYSWVANSARATLPALTGWALSLDGVGTVSYDETITDGEIIVTATLDLDGTVDEVDVLAQFATERDEWRAFGITLNVEVA